jgi:hypothetical protein
MDGVAMRWHPGNFVAWLVGSYHAATRSRPTSYATTVEREALGTLMVKARDHVVCTLERHASMEGGSAFIRDLIDKGALTWSLEVEPPAWVPVDSARLALRDRVLSLFAADLLARPRDYEASVVCRRCGELSLDGPCRCDSKPKQVANGGEHEAHFGKQTGDSEAHHDEAHHDARSHDRVA